ncbi:hypothetical protein ACTFIT_008147 [Dictyostelium discoideum]
MKDRANNKCPHLSVEEAEEDKNKYLWLLTDPNEFPIGYFKDCKMVSGQGMEANSLSQASGTNKKHLVEIEQNCNTQKKIDDYKMDESSPSIGISDEIIFENDPDSSQEGATKN